MLLPDRMAISRILPWMNGTIVEIGGERRITAFHQKASLQRNVQQYKTVNVYSFSLNSWNRIEERLGRYVSLRRLGEYYEVVLAEMVADGTLHLDAVFFNTENWYEIDSVKDLRNAERMFPSPPQIRRTDHRLSLNVSDLEDINDGGDVIVVRTDDTPLRIPE
jgi:hypothetical protein